MKPKNYASQPAIIRKTYTYPKNSTGNVYI